MKKRSLIVLGTRTDPQVDRVVSRLESLGCTGIKVLDYHTAVNFSLNVDRRGSLSLVVDNEEIVQPYLVWDRTKIIPGTRYYVRGDEISSGYSAQEWRSLYKLISALNPEYTVNSLQSKFCLIKPYQQTLAAAVGLRVPSTLVTNSKDDIINFQSHHPETILKSLSGGKVSPKGEGEYIPYVIMTMRATKADIIAADSAEFLSCPHLFQEEIKKKHELRVVVAGENIISFRIESQQFESTKVDWRKATGLNSYNLCEIDEDLKNKIFSFMKKMGLVFGSLDFIVDMNGENWFLECNQEGAWAWLDDIADGQVTDAFAQEFLKRLNSLGVVESKDAA